MSLNEIIIKNAHTNNLRNIDLKIPKHKFVTFTGVSGSGKSSLLFDTIYTEAQRQLIETFSTFARARMPKLSRPDVDDILNLSTAIVIDQKRMGKNLRSTVGTATEINTYLRLLFSRIGKPFIGPSFLFSFNHPDGMCPHCHGLGKQVRVDIHMFLDKEKSLGEGAITHPNYKVGNYLWKELVALELFDMDKKIKDFSESELHTLLYSEPFAIKDSKKKLSYSKNFEGLARKIERTTTTKAEDESPDEKKDAYKKYLVYSDCSICNGSRLNEQALSVTINGINMAQLCQMEQPDVLEFLSKIKDDVSGTILRKAKYLCSQLIDIGVGYLSLDRSVATLSGGESQRVKMAKQLDCNLVDLLYVLDEPSIGLHPRDTEKLISILNNLRDKGNSVFVVEHDPEIIKASQWIVDMGPKAGSFGGEVVYSGVTDGIINTKSITGEYLYNKTKNSYIRKKSKDFISIKNANVNNLKNVCVDIPKGVLTCVTGVAGSGKSSLIHDCFVKENPGAVVIDQSVIGKSSRANTATYTGVFDLIRKEFSNATGEHPSLFSFNSKGGCPNCKGQGSISFELNFLDAVKTVCDKCNGKRYPSDVLKHKFMNKNISDVLNMTVRESLEFFKSAKILKHLKILNEVGLSYLKIGQPLSTLSGGESQRLKIATELHKEGNIYVMDEPTTGLHMSDIDNFYNIIKSLVDGDNTVIIIEHNLDIIKHADWIIDLGPEGGKNGGEVLFEGTPEDLVKEENSITGKYLKDFL